jgi:adenosylcobinamide-GDP ribazoletransferase
MASGFSPPPSDFSEPPRWRRAVDQLHLAVVFLTRLPMPHLPDPCPSVGASLWAFPLVGAALGGLAGGLVWGAQAVGLPAAVAAVLGFALLAWVTGALHEDGLADVADGFGGGGDRARKMEILRDSRIGSYGVVALVLAFGLRLAVVTALPPLTALGALVASQALGRAMIPLAMVLIPAARSDGLGASAGRPPLLTVGLALGIGALAGAVTGWGSLVVLAAALVSCLILCRLAKRQIGGYTGDVLGTVALGGELAVLVAVSIELG